MPTFRPSGEHRKASTAPPDSGGHEHRIAPWVEKVAIPLLAAFIGVAGGAFGVIEAQKVSQADNRQQRNAAYVTFYELAARTYQLATTSNACTVLADLFHDGTQPPDPAASYNCVLKGEWVGAIDTSATGMKNQATLLRRQAEALLPSLSAAYDRFVVVASTNAQIHARSVMQHLDPGEYGEPPRTESAAYDLGLVWIDYCHDFPGQCPGQ